MTNIFKWSHITEVVMYLLSCTHFIWLIVTYSFQWIREDISKKFKKWEKDNYSEIADTEVVEFSENVDKKALEFFELLLGCPTVNFGPFSRGQSH